MALTEWSVFVGANKDKSLQMSPTFLIAKGNADNNFYVLECDPITGELLTSNSSAPGTVFGPGSSTDNAIVRWDGTTGALIQNSGITIDDSGNMVLAALATVDGRDISVDGANLDSHIANTSNPHATTKTQVGLGNVTNDAQLKIASNLSDVASVTLSFGNISPLTTKGDILGYSTLNVRLAVGTNGQVLTADSTTATGLKWATPTTGTVTSVDGSGGTTGLTLTGGPITSSGTLTIGGTLAVANGGTNSTAALNNNRLMVSSGGAIVEAAAITASRALISDANGIPVASSVTSATLAFLDATSSVQTQLNAKQPLDATLTALAAYNTNGIMTQTAADTFTGRTLIGTANQVIIANGDGVSGNPTFTLPQSIGTGSSPTFTGMTLSGMTPGSVLFAGTGGAITQDNANVFWDDTNNRLGIGTSSPAFKLDVAGSVQTTGDFKVKSSTPLIWLVDTTTADTGFFAYADAAKFNIASATDAGGKAADLLTVDRATGNVGIGNSSPSAILHVTKTTEQLRLGYDSSNYLSTTVSSVGLVTLDATGSGSAFRFNDKIGVGMTPTYLIDVLDSQTDFGTKWVQRNRVTSSVTTSSSNFLLALDMDCTDMSITAGVTDSGYRLGIRGQAYAATAGFAGTLAGQTGAWGRVGISSATAGAAVTNSYAFYAEVLNAVASTTITNAYGLYVSNSATVGTITNRWGVYVDTGSSGSNYFSGQVGVGTLNAVGKLHSESTTEQLRLGFDSVRYSSFTVASTGALTLASATNASIGAAITLTPSASNSVGSAGGAMTVNSGAGIASGSGGAGGTLSILGGAANGDDTVSRVGGPIVITAGSSKGSGAGGGITITTGSGGVGTGTAGANGGQGLLVGGTGGIGSATSGNGGASLINGGVGGAGVVGGTGGLARLLGGAGGAGSSTGGTGGQALLQAGPGGATAGASGGAATITGGTGSATGSGGAGGSVTINGGVAGGDNTVSRAGGDVIILGGASKGSAQGGAFTMFAGTGGPGTSTVGAIGGDVNVLGGVGGNNATTSGAGGATIIGGGTGGTTGTPGAGGDVIFKTAATVTLAERMRITNAGYVGIGVSTPVSILEACESTGGVFTLSRNDTSITADDMIGKIQFYASDTSSTTNKIVADIEAQATNTVTTDINPGRLIFRTTANTVAATPTERMRIDEAGNVGIGVTSAAFKLDVGGAIQTIGDFKIKSATPLIWLVDTTTADTGFFVYTDAAKFRVASSTDAGAKTADLVTVDRSTGNVGIGTTSPSTLLHVISTSAQVRVGYDTSNYLGVTVASTGSTTLATTSATNSSITLTPSGTGQVVLSKNVTVPHIIGSSTAPTIAAGAGAGTTPTVTVSNATDLSGIVNVTTGTLPTAAAVIVTITFNVAYGVAPNISLTPANAATALLGGATMVYVTSTTTTFVINAGTTGLVAATAYKWFYTAIQ